MFICAQLQVITLPLKTLFHKQLTLIQKNWESICAHLVFNCCLFKMLSANEICVICYMYIGRSYKLNSVPIRRCLDDVQSLLYFVPKAFWSIQKKKSWSFCFLLYLHPNVISHHLPVLFTLCIFVREIKGNARKIIFQKRITCYGSLTTLAQNNLGSKQDIKMSKTFSETLNHYFFYEFLLKTLSKNLFLARTIKIRILLI